MAGLFAHCAFNLNPRATSIDTPPHAFIPHAHVDHMHADAIIALAAARDGERLTREIFDGDDRLGALAAAGVRPGPEGGRAGARAAARCGAWSWAATACSPGARPRRSATRRPSAVIQQRGGLARRAKSRARAVRPARWRPPLPEGERDALVTAHRARAARPAQRAAPQGPALRGHARGDGVREQRARRRAGRRWAPPAPTTSCARACGRSSCPSRRSGSRPPTSWPRLPGRSWTRYRDEYAAYYERCRRPDSPAMRDPYPVIVLDPRRGLLASRRTRPPRASPPSTT